MQQIFNKVRAWWLNLPLGFRAAVKNAVLAALAALVGFNFVLPQNVPQAEAEAYSALLVVGAAVWSVVQTQILPNIVPWFLGTTKSQLLLEESSRLVSAANKAR